MLTTFFKAFEATEIQLTAKAIKRLRISALLTYLVLPCYPAFRFLELSKNVEIPLIIILTISVLAMIYSSLTRLANRLWMPESYLDEVEIERKRRSASLTLQIMFGLLTVVAIVSVFFHKFTLGAEIAWTPLGLGYLFISLGAFAANTQIFIAACMTQPLADATAETIPADIKYKWSALVFLIGLIVFSLILGFLTK